MEGKYGMTADKPEGPAPGPELYERALEEARQVSDKALARLRALGDDLPPGLVAQVERLHDDPVAERRKAARVSYPEVPAAVVLSGVESDAVVRDHSPAGVAVLLPCPAGEGTVLRVRVPPALGGPRWVVVEVKHCHREGRGWVAGCELLDGGPI